MTLIAIGGLFATIDSEAQDKAPKASVRNIERDRIEATLSEDIRIYTERAVKEKIMSAGKADSIRIYIRDSLPESQELRISALQLIRDGIDNLYDNFTYSSEEITSCDYSHIASSMVPKILAEPEDFVDPYERRIKNAMEGTMKTKEMIALTLGQEKSKIPKWARPALMLLFNKGLDPTFKTIPVHGGLYYIAIPPGKPAPTPWTKEIPKAYKE